MQINVNDYKPNEVLKFIRQYTNKTQAEFANSINKSHAWQQSNELGRTNFFFKDLLEIVQKYNLEIIIRNKKED